MANHGAQVLFLTVIYALMALGDAACLSWCNPYTADMASCGDCTVSQEVKNGDYCASWCNDWTASMTMCLGCSHGSAPSCPPTPEPQPKCFDVEYGTQKAIADQYRQTLTNETMFAFGTAKIYWYPDTDHYWVKAGETVYPAGVGCTWQDVLNADPASIPQSANCKSPIVGSHLHYYTGEQMDGDKYTGSGPVAVVFCMGKPLPTYTPDTLGDTAFPYCSPYIRYWNMGGLYDQTVNGKTSGGMTPPWPPPATTQSKFKKMMQDCYDGKKCKVYYNIHSTYSFKQTGSKGGTGLARGTLVPSTCDGSVPPLGPESEGSHSY